MESERIKAFIFDLDGVIVFTDCFHYQAWKRLADELGVYFDETINHRLRGVSRMESLAIVLEKSSCSYTQEEMERLAERKNQYYRALLEGMKPSDVEQEVRDTLTELRQRGHKLAIGSSSKNTKFILEKTEMADYFDAVSDGTNITKSKPDPEVFVKAALFLQEDTQSCIVVEDAPAGIEAAKACGCCAVGIGEAASYAKTDISIQRFSQILSI